VASLKFLDKKKITFSETVKTPLGRKPLFSKEMEE
jgi:hypothetical protein